MFVIDLAAENVDPGIFMFFAVWVDICDYLDMTDNSVVLVAIMDIDLYFLQTELVYYAAFLLLHAVCPSVGRSDPLKL